MKVYPGTEIPPMRNDNESETVLIAWRYYRTGGPVWDFQLGYWDALDQSWYSLEAGSLHTPHAWIPFDDIASTLEHPGQSLHWQRVFEFVNKASKVNPAQVTNTRPTMPDEDSRRLAAKLILEEATELIKGLGFSLSAAPTLIPSHEPNLVEIADGTADLHFVTTVAQVMCGIHDVEIQTATDENNLEKFAPGHFYNSDGKLCKPPGWRPVDYEFLLLKQLANWERNHG